MALNLYRRHNGTCSQKRKPRLQTRKADEAPRFGWKKCDCPIYASGTLKDGFKRKETGYTTWPEAEAQAQSWQQAGAWEQAGATTKLATVPDGNVQLPTGPKSIVDGLADFIDMCERRKIKPPTLRKYKTLAKQFQAYCDRKGYVTTNQIKIGDGELFSATWKDGAKAWGKKKERFQGLVLYWGNREWIEHDMGASNLLTPIGANDPSDQMPFTDDELSQMYDACDGLGTVEWKNHLGSGSWDGEDVKDFIVLSVYTGMRISDVTLFDIDRRMIGNGIFIRAKKNGKRLFTWVPDWVRDRLVSRAKRFGSRIFHTAESERLDTQTDLWRRKLMKVFTKANITDGKPHRFRFTFVRILLQSGVSVPDVAELVGDTEEVISDHYAKWVPELQERLTDILKAAFVNRPQLIPTKRQREDDHSSHP